MRTWHLNTGKQEKYFALDHLWYGIGPGHGISGDSSSIVHGKCAMAKHTYCVE